MTKAYVLKSSQADDDDDDEAKQELVVETA